MPSTWSGSIWIGTGCAYFIGGSGDSAPHAHHLIQIVVGLNGDIAIEDAFGSVSRSPGFLIPSNLPHRVISDHPRGGVDSLMVFVESFSLLGKRLSSRGGGACRSIDSIDELRVSTIRGLIGKQRCYGSALVEEVVSTLMGQTWHVRAMDRRVALAIDHIERGFNDPDVFQRIAEALGISHRYLRKIFEHETGMTMQRFRLWSKLKKAIDHALSGGTLTHASLLAGFSDSAHFSRTFRDMFGASPSQVFEKLPKPTEKTQVQGILDRGSASAGRATLRRSVRVA